MDFNVLTNCVIYLEEKRKKKKTKEKKKIKKTYSAVQYDSRKMAAISREKRSVRLGSLNDASRAARHPVYSNPRYAC